MLEDSLKLSPASLNENRGHFLLVAIFQICDAPTDLLVHTVLLANRHVKLLFGAPMFAETVYHAFIRTR